MKGILAFLISIAITIGWVVVMVLITNRLNKKDKEKETSNTETYCLWASCKKFESCPHDDYICTGKPDCMMTLEEAKKKYPDAKFCEDWESDK